MAPLLFHEALRLRLRPLAGCHAHKSGAKAVVSFSLSRPLGVATVNDDQHSTQGQNRPLYWLSYKMTTSGWQSSVPHRNAAKNKKHTTLHKTQFSLPNGTKTQQGATCSPRYNMLMLYSVAEKYASSSAVRGGPPWD